MNFIARAFYDRRLKSALSTIQARLDSGSKGLRGNVDLTLEAGVKLHNIKIFSSDLTIGAYTDIVSGSELHEVLSIGRYCSIAKNVTVGHDRRSHPLHWATTHSRLCAQRGDVKTSARLQTKPCPAVIGHDVWIGMDTLIMDGVTIGIGAVIGAQSLVNKDVPAYAIVAGTPAAIIRYRFDPATIAALLASRWWALAPDAISRLPLENPAEFARRAITAHQAPYKPARVRISTTPMRFEAAPALAADAGPALA